MQSSSQNERADGHEFIVKPPYDPKVEDYLKPVFQSQYTMSFENYPVTA